MAAVTATRNPDFRVGVVGSGFVARGFCALLRRQSGYRLSRLLTRRALSDVAEIAGAGEATNDLAELVDHSDLVVECSGRVGDACAVVDAAFSAGLPVVTMNAEFQVTAGAWYAERGRLSEAEGDQPGSIAALAEDVRTMGFEPLVYGSQKGFLKHNPDLASMRSWSERQGIALAKTVSFTDGTKLQIEAALVANGLGAEILRPGLVGPVAETTRDGALTLAPMAAERGAAISDYVLRSGGGGEVFIVATHDAAHRDSLRYYKLGDGPYYYFERPFHLGHFEVMKTVRRLAEGGAPLLGPGARPRLSVGAVAKRELARGERIETAIGGFAVRGHAVTLASDHAPIALLDGAELRHRLEPGQPLALDDVAIEDGPALRAWRGVRDAASATDAGSR